MTEAALYFDHDIDCERLIEDLRGLPDLIRPVYFAEDEDKIIKANVLFDTARFEIFQKRNPSAFLLYSKNKTCIQIKHKRVAGYAKVILWLTDDLSSDLAVIFLRKLVGHKPIFGYSSKWDEYLHRNRYYIKLGMNNIKTWIGRDLDKYIPGVYWHTLISDRFLERHSVRLTDLSAEAVMTEALDDGSLHLLKFFEKADDWQDHRDRLDKLCERVDGVFSRSSVEVAVCGVKNYLEYSDAIDNWG